VRVESGEIIAYTAIRPATDAMIPPFTPCAAMTVESPRDVNATTTASDLDSGATKRMTRRLGSVRSILKSPLARCARNARKSESAGECGERGQRH
jgi:hypothetical protein